jgi:branched-chain amino acid transport system substrate-binding protein
MLDNVTASALAADIDVTIGPLFSYPMTKIAPVMAAYNIPVLSLSNNMAAAQTGAWVLGYLPEQQLDNLLAHTIEQNKLRIAILASEDSFGQTLLSHAQTRLGDFGLSAAQITILSQAMLADEASLKEAIRQFTRYQRPADDSAILPPPLYDTVLLAGNPDFILRTAPVLDYYDLGPSRATFLGTDLWGRAELVSEPSLQGAVITQAILPEKERFDAIWRDYFSQYPSSLSRLGFDVMAVIAITTAKYDGSTEIDWTRSLLRDKGFSGFSGAFSLMPDGRNNRDYKLYRISDGKLADL